MVSSRTVAAIFDAENSRFIAKVLQMAKVTRDMSTEVSRAAVKNQQDWNRLGNSMLGAGALIGGGLALVTTAAIQWQSEFAGVAKTVGGTEQQLSALDGQLRGLARTMSSSHQEIAQVAENAGQLGVATQDIARFTRTMLMLGESTNLSADEASTSIAQLMTIMGTAPDKVDKLGAVLVRLGNNGASTESQIVQLSQRIAGASRAIGLSEEQVLGWSSAIASTGMNVEAGGTAMSRVFTRLDRLVSGNSDKLKVLNELTGTDFAHAFKTDASGAVLDLVQSLGTLQKQGGSITSVLDQIGVKSVYESDVLRRLAGAGTLAGEQLGYASDEMGKGTALLIEYQKRQETAAARIQVAWNNLRDSAIDMGSELLPAVSGGADGLADLVHRIQSIPGPIKAGAVQLAGFAAASLLVVGGGMKVAGVVSNMTASYAALAEKSPKAAAGIKKAAVAALAFAAATAALKAFTTAYDDFAAGNRTKNADLASGMLLDFNRNAHTLDLSKVFGTEQKNAFTGEVYSAREALKRAFSPDFGSQLADGFWGGFGISTSGSRIKDQVSEVDKALSSLVASGNSDAAFKGYRDFQQFVEASGVSFDKVRPSLTAFRQQLELTAEGLNLGGQISEREFVDWMGGKIPAAVTKATIAGGDLVSNLTDQQRALAGVTTTTEQYTAALWDAANAALKLSGSKIGFEAAIDDTAGTIKGNQKRRGKGTKVGDSTSMNYAVNRENKQALDDLATASQTYINTLIDQDASTTKVVDVTQRARDKYIAAAVAAGYGAEKAKEMADDMGLIPDDVKATIETKLERDAINAWTAYKPGDKYPKIRPKLTQSTFDVTLRTTWRINGGPKFSTADGAIYGRSGDRVVKSFENGGYLTPIGSQQPQIQTNRGPAGIQWAETGAGPWEAFVSGHPAKRDRSQQIASEVVSRLGGSVEWRNADGGVRDYQQYSRSGDSRPPIVINTTTYYPVAEPQSESTNKALQVAAAVGVGG